MFLTASLYLSLAVFMLGAGIKASAWFRRSIGASHSQFSTSERVAAALKGIRDVVMSRKLFTLLRVFVVDGVLQIRLLRRSRLRWAMHMCIYGGFMMLLLMHGFGKFTSAVLFRDYYPTLNPFFFLRDLFAAMVAAGAIAAIARRIASRGRRLRTAGPDRLALGMIALIILSGIALEGVKISSRSLFLDMVDEYGNPNDAGETQALETYWAKEFGLVSPAARGPARAELLRQGKAAHETNCAGCHSRTQWAFMGYGSARLLAPAAPALDRSGARNVLLYTHYLAALLGLAYLPFSKMFHIFTGPLSLMANSVMSRETSDPANIATKQIMELDACTHCGACTLECAAAVASEVLHNENILPSEKMIAVKALAAGSKPGPGDIAILRQGIHLCTDCGRCTSACPVGINLGDLWIAVRDALLEQSVPEFLLLSPLSIKWMPTRTGSEQNVIGYRNAVALAKTAISEACDPEGARSSAAALDPGVIVVPGGLEAQAANLNTQRYCFDCVTCTNVCPVVGAYDDPESVLGLLPHQIMHAMKLRLWNVVLSSEMLWSCLGCYECQQECPMGVKITDIFYALKNAGISCARDSASKQLEAQVNLGGKR